jgi:hypothetical protein
MSHRDSFKYHWKPCPLCTGKLHWDDTGYCCLNYNCGLQDVGETLLDQIEGRNILIRKNLLKVFTEEFADGFINKIKGIE